MFSYFYHGTLEKVQKAFGSLFNKIYVAKYDLAGNEVSRTLVPINYVNRHTYIARLEAQPKLEDEVFVEAIFPRLAFEITGLSYNTNRKLNTGHRQYSDETTEGTKAAAYQSVSHDLDFTLTIVAKHVIDANQILEQILPYFTPAYTVTINAIPEMGYQEDIPIELHSTVPSDNYAEELDGNQREIRWELNFTAQIQFHGPVEQAKIIQKVQIDILTPVDFAPETLDKTPRIARDTTITDPPNAQPQDDFGYTETWQEFQDGKKYDPALDEDVDV